MQGAYTPQLGRQFAVSVAKRYGLDPALFTAQLQQESGFRADAVSPVGARGPGQIMPATWEDPGFGLSFEGSIDNPFQNIEAAAQYQRTMLDRYDGDVNKALAAYNWGAGNADKWSGDPSALPGETRNYIQSITEMARGNSPVTIADEAAGNSMFAQQRQQPSIMEEREQKPTFHAGNALQSLGAAISATALGESAAPQLGQIRDQYFAEQEAEYQKQMEQQQRQALISMVGADSTYGQALANGASPEAVLQAYMQEQGFSHAEDMAAQGFQYERQLANDQFGYNSQLADKEFDQQRVLNRDQFGYGRMAAADDAGYLERRDERLAAQEAEAAATSRNSTVTDRQGLRESYAVVAERMHGKEAGDLIRGIPDQAFSDVDTATKFMEGVIGPEATKDLQTTVLSPGQVLVDQTGRQIAQGLPEPQEAFRPLTPAEIQELGLSGEQGKAFQVNEATGEIKAIGGGGVTVNTGDGVKLAQGEGYITDAEGNFVIDPATGLRRAAPVPGSSLDREMQAQEAERQANSQKAMNAQRNKIQKAGTILQYLGVAREQAQNPLATGFMGQLTGFIGGSPNSQLRNTLIPLTSNIAFEELANMRANSPTGGALGSVAVEELRQLQGVLGSLDPEQGEEGMLRSLDTIEQHYTAIIEDVMTDGNLSAEDRAYALTMLGVSDEEQRALQEEEAASSTSVPTVSTEADYRALPSGALYTDPSGVTRRKK